MSALLPFLNSPTTHTTVSVRPTRARTPLETSGQVVASTARESSPRPTRRPRRRAATSDDRIRRDAGRGGLAAARAPVVDRRRVYASRVLRRGAAARLGRPAPARDGVASMDVLARDRSRNDLLGRRHARATTGSRSSSSASARRPSRRSSSCAPTARSSPATPPSGASLASRPGPRASSSAASATRRRSSSAARRTAPRPSSAHLLRGDRRPRSPSSAAGRPTAIVADPPGELRRLQDRPARAGRPPGRHRPRDAADRARGRRHPLRPPGAGRRPATSSPSTTSAAAPSTPTIAAQDRRRVRAARHARRASSASAASTSTRRVFAHVDGHGPRGRCRELDPNDPATLAGVARLREECRRAKEALSADTDATIPVVLPGLQTECG